MAFLSFVVGSHLFDSISDIFTTDRRKHLPQFPTLVNHSLHDVITLKHLLGSPSLNLPVKVVEQIMEYAEYWVYSTEDRQISNNVKVCGYEVQPDGVTYVQNWDLKEAIVMRTAPLGLQQQTNWWTEGLVQLIPRWIGGSSEKPQRPESTQYLPPKGKHPFRRIQFEILSRDKKEVEYEIPYWFTYPCSWCDALIQRGDKCQTRKRICGWQGKEKYQMHDVSWNAVQGNLYSTPFYFDPFRQAQQDRIAKFVHTLEVGDRLEIRVACIDNPYSSTIQRCRVTVWWAV